MPRKGLARSHVLCVALIIPIFTVKYERHTGKSFFACKRLIRILHNHIHIHTHIYTTAQWIILQQNGAKVLFGVYVCKNNVVYYYYFHIYETKGTKKMQPNIQVRNQNEPFSQHQSSPPSSSAPSSSYCHLACTWTLLTFF